MADMPDHREDSIMPSAWSVCLDRNGLVTHLELILLPCACIWKPRNSVNLTLGKLIFCFFENLASLGCRSSGLLEPSGRDSNDSRHQQGRVSFALTTVWALEGPAPPTFDGSSACTTFVGCRHPRKKGHRPPESFFDEQQGKWGAPCACSESNSGRPVRGKPPRLLWLSVQDLRGTAP